MGFKLKAGTKGNAVNYTTRNQALKRLQLKLSQFRRLCILKGIHPREPKKKRQGQNKTYYHVKDINFLLHEPLLDKFREIRAYDKKVRNKDRLRRRSSDSAAAALGSVRSVDDRGTPGDRVPVCRGHRRTNAAAAPPSSRRATHTRAPLRAR
jgi:pescadillo protein